MNKLKLFTVNSYVDNGARYYEDFRVVIAENAEEATCMVKQLLWDTCRADVESCDVKEVVFQKGVLGVPNKGVTVNG